MGYGGKVIQREQARLLRAQSWTLAAIAAELGVAKSSVSLWVRDVDFVPRPRNRGHRMQRPHPLAVAKAAEIERLRLEGLERIGQLSEREFLVAGVALYAAEGSKRGNGVRFANTDPRMILFFITWLRVFFDVDEQRLRMRLYLHEGLDLDAANVFWSELTGIQVSQFGKPYRAVPDATIRHSKHVMGCPSVCYSSAPTLRTILGLADALLGWLSLPG
jgi:transcriptional regulator with XRE-family HTH domain